MTFPITGKAKLTQNLPGNYVNANEAVETNEKINHGSVSFTITGNRTLTAEEKNSGIRWALTGTPGVGFTLTIPDGDRMFIVDNATGQTATLDTVGISTAKPTVATGATWLFVMAADEILWKIQLTAA